MNDNESQLTNIVVRALQRELRARRDLRPHALLAISPNAPLDVVEAAYRRLSAQYDPSAFAEHGQEAVVLARSIADLLRTAYETMRAERAPTETSSARRGRRDEPQPTRRSALLRFFRLLHVHRKRACPNIRRHVDDVNGSVSRRV